MSHLVLFRTAILQSLLNLAEFIEHDVKALLISLSILYYRYVKLCSFCSMLFRSDCICAWVCGYCTFSTYINVDRAPLTFPIAKYNHNAGFPDKQPVRRSLRYGLYTCMLWITLCVTVRGRLHSNCSRFLYISHYECIALLHYLTTSQACLWWFSRSKRRCTPCRNPGWPK